MMRNLILTACGVAMLTSGAWWWQSWRPEHYILAPHSNLILSVENAPDFSWHRFTTTDGRVTYVEHHPDKDVVTTWRWR
jgi:hypothetical protein